MKSETKSKAQKLRTKAKARGIDSLTELALLVPCSRVAIYFALEKPKRFSRVYRRIKELVHA